jgi:hypothetical protein
MSNDASPVASTPNFRMRTDMTNAPTGKKLLLINESGVLVVGTLTNNNRIHFVEWQYVPKRPKKFKIEV